MFNTKQFLVVILALLAFVGTCQAATLAFLSLTVPNTVTSGQTFSASAKMLDSSGNTMAASGSVVLSWEGSGTLGGSTVASFSNGVAAFSVSITVSAATSGMLKATYTSGGSTYSQSLSVDVQIGSNNPSGDYTSAWGLTLSGVPFLQTIQISFDDSFLFIESFNKVTSVSDLEKRI
ncbi:predicted protein [Naegleria gruberi]|uniref:Predicted protein n=1 Tax=Naegleria gruberi TaxID=5762 RepID=D2W4S2_NAEGR|nr:uncharacterized protein NAEGRDRAFT_76408 [Naegleria gruberi]EFC35932.1 predicted protein [Naegleria gruberi]|eukprot:XP_002668676.1 predicted protein [Naegleria gruberi strain NEG-M]